MKQRGIELVRQGYLTQAHLTYILQVTSGGVSKAISEGRIRAVSVDSWPAPVIPISEARRIAHERGMSDEHFARRVRELGQRSKWGPVVIAGIFALLGLGLIYLTTNGGGEDSHGQ